MRTLEMTVEYDGTAYCGWQVQNSHKSQAISRKQRTIQATLEKTLQKILQERVKVMGSGRTDSGAHALGQVAHFQTISRLSPTQIRKGLHSLLPADIRISALNEAPDDFHARFSATSKHYRYTIVNDAYLPVFIRRYAYLVRYPLNIAAMRRAARYLVGRHDFRSFQAVDKTERNSRRRISRLAIRQQDNLIIIDIEADGFLYKMVRNIAGTLIEVGRGRMRPDEIEKGSAHPAEEKLWALRSGQRPLPDQGEI